MDAENCYNADSREVVEEDAPKLQEARHQEVEDTDEEGNNAAESTVFVDSGNNANNHEAEFERDLPPPPPPPPSPCLSCLMRALQASGLLNACWSAAFAELEEAFAIKRVADAVTHQQQQQQQLQHEPSIPAKLYGGNQYAGSESRCHQQYRHHHPQQHQRHVPIRMPPPDPTKWHALESLCGLMSDLAECPHQSSGASSHS